MTGLSHWKMVFYLTGIFAAGAVSGWVVATKVDRQKSFKPPQTKEIATSLRDRLHARLSLAPEQARTIDGIIERSSTEMQSVHGENLKRIKSCLSNRTAQIQAALDPDQRKQYDGMEKDRGESWREGSAWRGKRGGRDGRDGRKSSRDKGATNNLADTNATVRVP